MQKTFTYIAAFALTLLSGIPAVQASGVGNPKATHIIHSNATPMSGFVRTNTFHIQLHVMGNPLEQLTIGLPGGLDVDEGMLEVTDENGQAIAVTVSMNDSQAVIAFAEALPSDSMVDIQLNKISGPLYIDSWMLPISARSSGMTSDVPLGLAQINTY